MQEEIENRTVNLAVSTTKLTARTVISAVRGYLNHKKTASLRKERASGKGTAGRQTVKELLGQGQGVSSLDISDTDLKGFERVARKYGIDYAVRKDASGDVPRYLVFFKAKDEDALTAAFREYSRKAQRREERPSVLRQLRKLRALIAAVPVRTVSRGKKRELNR